VKTIVDSNNNALAKSIADTNTNIFVTILFTVFTLAMFTYFCSHPLINLMK